MKALLKPSMWKILGLFYNNRNRPIHLREIARKVRLNESTVSTHLNNLVKTGILKIEKDANLKKFLVNKARIPEIFPFFDSDKLESLPLLRKDAIKIYINKLEKKPLFVIVFGSSAKGTFREDSDIDLLEVSHSKEKDEKAEKYAEVQTGIKLQVFKITEENFKDELRIKKDNVIMSAINTGFPVFNAKYFYEVLYNG